VTTRMTPADASASRVSIEAIVPFAIEPFTMKP
jgi:hypothetical protein